MPDISAALPDPELGFLRFTVRRLMYHLRDDGTVFLFHVPGKMTGVPVEGKGFNKPLYDTGQLYNEFDYDVVSSKS